MRKWQNVWLVSVMAVLLIGLSVFTWLKPMATYSDSERRPLATEYKEDFETYAQDQFPLRDSFRSIKMLTALGIFGQLDSNGLYVKDGHISRLEYPVDETMLAHAAARFQYLNDTYLTGMDVYFSIIPDKNYFLTASAPENNSLISQYPSLDYEHLVSYMQERTSYMTYIDIFPLLSIDDYYKTDSHWRQECLGDVASQLAEEMGTELTANYRTMTATEDFAGVYSGQLALPMAPDTLNYLTNAMLEQCIATSYDTGNPVKTSIYDYDAVFAKDPYTLFPDDAIFMIENPAATTTQELIIFRDSFGGSLAPLLCEAYSKVTLVDIRYVDPSQLQQWIEFNSQDVLFLYSTVLLNDSQALK